MNSRPATREISLTAAFAALVIGAATTGAQQSSGHWWALSGYYGGAPTATGGGVGPLMRAPELIGGSIKIRLGQRPLWIGVDLDEFTAPPTGAGLDSLVAQAGKPRHPENGGRYFVTVSSVSLRYDAWTYRPLTLYEIASVGKAATNGYIYGQNCSLSGCEEPATSVSFPGSRFAASIGGGMLVRLTDIAPEFKYFPGSIHVEARLATVGTHHGRMLSAPLLVGVTW